MKNHFDRFRDQHAAVMGHAVQLHDELDAARLAVDASAARQILVNLSARVRQYLETMAEDVLPALLDSADPAHRRAATRCSAHLLPLAKGFADYVRRWPSATAIAARPAVFVADTRTVLALLGDSLGLQIAAFPASEHRELAEAV